MLALISIHDVMPHTLDEVQDILSQVSHLPAQNISLLVVPGLDWKQEHLDRLHALENAGFVLAGHGWYHHAREIRGLYHHLHSALLSRDVAEHLSLGGAEIRKLLDACFYWFTDKGFMPPDLYVPPAWAMGNIGKNELRQSPFRFFENTSGLYDSVDERQVNLPLAGFEADNTFRAVSLSFWNRINLTLASATRPLRLSIHPHDRELKLKESLARFLASVTATANYRSI